MITVNDVFEFLNGRFPCDTACDFDNVGLLIGDKASTVTSAVVALDCSLETVNAAKQRGAELIITHHPVIFDPLKSVTANGVVFEAIRGGISVISMHTNLDVGAGGVNDTLCEMLELQNIAAFEAVDGYPLKSGTVAAKTPKAFAEHIKACLGGSVRYVCGNRDIERVLVCSGSGGNFLDDALRGGFDALVTADVKHNVFVDAINAGVSLYDAGHFATEDIIVKPLAEMLSKQFSGISFSEFHTEKIKFI